MALAKKYLFGIYYGFDSEISHKNVPYNNHHQRFVARVNFKNEIIKNIPGKSIVMLSKWSMVSSLGRNKSFSLEATKHSTVPSFNEFMLSNSIKRLSTEARMFSKKPRTSLAGAS